MSWPKPEPGLVIRYSYLWRSEHAQGREDGVKDRPCAIVVAVRQADGRDGVLVVPITHSVPDDVTGVMEIPAETKKRLGLDGERSWVVLTESNTFNWPGPDLRPVGGRADGSVAYGVLPPRFQAELQRRFMELERVRRSRRVARTE